MSMHFHAFSLQFFPFKFKIHTMITFTCKDVHAKQEHKQFSKYKSTKW